MRTSSYLYSVSAEIFHLFPGYVRGVVVASDVRNRESPPELLALLRQAEADLRGRLELDRLLEEPHIQAWREAFRAFGVKPSEFRPSIEALARRVLRGEPLPSINALVDIGNLISLCFLIPTGGHAIDRLQGDISLRLADGRERFIPLGSEEMEHPLPGEVIFAEGDFVLTRRWIWRQGQHTLTHLETTAIEYNIDGLPPTTSAEVEAVCSETAALIERFCGGKIRWQVLSEQSPVLVLS